MINPYYDFSLKPAGLLIGAVLIVAHLAAIFLAEPLQGVLRKFPRSRGWGFALLTIDAAWAFWLISTMDLGEFFTLRSKLQIAIPIAYVLVVIFVEEFLSVRALGTLMLLVACVVLDTAWFEYRTGVVLLPILAYAWIILGIFFVGMPYLMRDQVNWLSQKSSRWRAACIGGAVYGALIVTCALMFY